MEKTHHAIAARKRANKTHLYDILPLHNKLNDCFLDVNVCLTPKSNSKLRNLLKVTKDASAHNKRPGIFAAECKQSE